jgi:Zn2+/Cd2+-exporting ATPase
MSLVPPGPRSARATGGATVLHIPTMDCPSEESDIRRALAGVPGIRALRFELAARSLTIDASPDALAAAVAAIRRAGFASSPVAPQDEVAPEQGQASFDRGIWRAGLALLLAMGAEALHSLAPDTLTYRGLGMAIAAGAIGLSGVSTYAKGWAALRRGQLNMNALMGIAVTGAFLIGQWPEGAMVMALYAIAELIEARSVDRARHAIESLLALAPDTAEMQQAGGGWVDVPAGQVPLDALVRVRPGGRIPLDGLVTAGASAVDQASVTGESIPVDKAVGDLVFAGTINQTGMLELRVTAAASDTTLARIVHAVEQAQSTRAPTQRFVDRFAAIYTPAVFVAAVAVALAAPLWLGWTWTQAIYKALVLLVIACPCALVIATPVTVVSALAAAARRGILIKGGVYLEEARRLRAIALDKTGTLTDGKPRLVATEVLASTEPESRVLSWAASLAGHSDHPVSQAIAAGLALPEDGVSDFSALPGRGIEARLDGRGLLLGNHRLIEERRLCSPEIEARLQVHETQGRTLAILACDEEVFALFAVADTLKETSRKAVADLHRLGVVSMMLTGDNAATAASIARQAGIDAVRANLLPEDKLAAIEDLRRRHGPVAMVGDGINDAPALACADIGVAMGAAGTDTAMEAADILIMNDDLRRIPEAIRLSHRTHAVLWQNIALALGIKVVFLVLALAGNATMWMAVFADMGASLLVVFNGLRLLRTGDRAGHAGFLSLNKVISTR